MKSILNQLSEYKTLNSEQAYSTIIKISNNEFNNSQLAAFMAQYAMRNITVEELIGFRKALLELCIKVDLGTHECIDLCGTGGDSKNTFNISTLASFIVASAGYKVAKHGNYGVSSISGSSNVLEFLGYTFTNDINKLKETFNSLNICFMHAPLFHPALKAVSGVRKDLGVKTFFNMLGPLVNPAQPNYQFTGVFNMELARIYNYLYQNENKSYCIIHSIDGYDEVSLTAPVKVYSNCGEYFIYPDDMSLSMIKEQEIEGGASIDESAQLFLNILNNKGTESQSKVVLANAAFAIHCMEPELTLNDCYTIAREALQSGKSLETFNSFIKSAS